jgi:hypothetical protein
MEPMRESKYVVSSAIDALVHDTSGEAEKLRRELVTRLRDATTDALNHEIERGTTICSDGFNAGITEGFVEALYHDTAAGLAAGVPIDDLAKSIDEVSGAVTQALSELKSRMTGSSVA